MPEKQLQEHLFQHIKELLPPGQSLVETISEALNVSQDSAYRRIRGETLLVLDEAKVLCEQFSISLDQIFQLNNNSVVFHNTKIDAQQYDFTAYLKGILHNIKELNRFSDKSLLYQTKDIPIFHLFSFRPLLAFRYYFWMRTTFGLPEILQQPFSFELLPAETEAVGKEILSFYNRLPSVEIWNTESINSTLQQINHCRDAGLMTRTQGIEVHNSLRYMLEHLQKQAAYGRKFLPDENPHCKKDNFQLFYNRIGLGGDVILTTCDGKKTIYVNNDALDYLTCMDETYCNKVYQKLQMTMRRSTLISSVSEKQRDIFFNSLYTKLPHREINNEKLLS